MKISMFEGYNEQFLKGIFYFLSNKDHIMNQDVYRENDPITDFYIINKGTFKVNFSIVIIINFNFLGEIFDPAWNRKH